MSILAINVLLILEILFLRAVVLYQCQLIAFSVFTDQLHVITLIFIATLIVLLFYLIYKRYRYCKAVQLKDAYLNAISEAVPDFIFRIADNGTISAYLKETSKSEQLFGKNIIEGTIQDYFTPFADKILELVHIALRLSKMQVLEFSLEVAGTKKYFEMRIIKAATNEVLAVIREFTKEKKILESLRKSENRYRGLIESQSDMIVRVDLEGRFLFVNDAYCEKFGKKSEDLLGNSFQPLVHEDDLKKTLEAMKGLYHPPYRISVEQRAKAKDGWCWISWEDFAIHDHDGNISEIQAVGRDITEYKKTLESLLESEKFNRAVTEQSPIGITIRNRFGRLISYNRSWREIWQLTDEQIADYMESERTHLNLDERDEYLGGWTEQVLKIYSDGGQLHIPELFAKRRKKWIAHYFYALKDADDKVEKVVILTEDITARKKYEKAVLESEEKYRSLVNNIPIGVYRSTVNKGLVSVNPAMAHIYGHASCEEMLLIDPTSHYHKDEVRERMIQELNEKGFITNQECEMVKSDGTKIYVLSSCRAVKDEFGEIKYIDGFDLDVTDRHMAVQALQESEEKFRFMAENTPAGILIYVGEKLVYSNPEASRLTGYSNEELLSKKYIDFVAPEMKDLVADRGRKRLAGEDVMKSYELALLKKNGEKIWTYFTGGRVEFNGEAATIGTIIDITEKKILEEKMILIEQEKYNQVKEIAGGISHEIYNSLFPAISSLEKLKERNSLTSQEERERNIKLIELSDAAVSRAISMTELVMEFSKIDQKKDLHSIDVKEFVENYIREHEHLFREKNIVIRSDVESSVIISINQNHFYSLFNNIVQNAADALEGVNEGEILIKALAQNEQVKIVIADNGSGISPKVLPRIFNPFFSTKPKTGTGLGLAICKKIVEMYNGSLTVSSDIDNGTEFTILFKTKLK